MSFYTYFLSEKTVITIIKCIPLNEDIHFLILETLIHRLIGEEFFENHNEFIDDEIYWFDIDLSN